MKYLLNKAAFVDWMLEDDEDIITATSEIRNSLIKNNQFTLTIKELLDKTGFLPTSLFDNQKEVEADNSERTEIYTFDKVEFTN